MTVDEIIKAIDAMRDLPKEEMLAQLFEALVVELTLALRENKLSKSEIDLGGDVISLLIAFTQTISQPKDEQ